MSVLIRGLTDEGALTEALTKVMNSNAAFSLVVSDGLSERIFYFTLGGLREIASGELRGTALCDVLVEIGHLERRQVAALMDGREDRSAGQFAVESGLILRPQHDEALRIKVEEDLLELFMWDGAEVRLMEGNPPGTFYGDQLESASLSVAVPEFIQSVLLQVDHWRGASGRVPTGREILETVDASVGSDRPPALQELIRQLDGTRTLLHAIEASDARRVPAVRLVASGLADGRIRRVVGGAAQRASREQYVREMLALEKALSVSVEPDIVRTRLAKVCEAAGEKARAAEHWKQLGDEARKAGDFDRALLAYRNTVRLVPMDFATRELVLEILRHQRNYRLVINEGRPLANLFIKHNLLNRAKGLLLQLVGLDETDAALRRQLILVLIGLGEKDLALKHLRILAALLEGRDATPSELRDVYLRILALDKRDRAIAKKLDRITGVTAQRRLLVITGSLTAAVLALFLGAFWYESRANAHYAAVIEEARAMVEQRQVGRARALLDSAMTRFELSSSHRAAQELMDDLEELEALLIQQARERVTRPTPSLREQAKEQSDKAEGFLAAGRLREGHRIYVDLFREYPWAVELKDVRLPLKVVVLPPHAQVWQNGEEMGQGAVTLLYSPQQKNRIRIEAEGFEPYEIEFRGTRDLDLNISLTRPVLWSFQSDAPFESAPLVHEGTVYVAGRDRFLTALSAADGSVRWRVPLGLYDDVAVSPVMTAQGVVVTTAEGDALCVDPTTGEPQWRTQLGARAERQPIASAAGPVIIPDVDGGLHAVSPRDGNPLWTAPPGTVADGVPVEMPGTSVGFVDQMGGITLLSVEDGRRLPGRAPPSRLRGTPTNDNGRVWVWCADSTLRMLSAESLTPLRQFPVPRHWEHVPAMGVDTAYVITREGRLMAFRADGEMLFEPRPLGIDPSASPVYASGKLYVPSKDGGVYVLSAATGEPEWRIDAGGSVDAPPVVQDGVVYATTAAGRVVAVQQ